MKALVCILLLLETFVFVVQQQVDGGLNENEISQQISSEDGRQNPPQTDTLRAEASTDRQQYCDLGFPDIYASLRELTATVTEQKENIRALETQLRDEMNKKDEEISSQVEELRKENRGREIAFSASVMESGEGYTGPFTTEITLTYKKVFTNIGNAYNPITGVFTAPLKGAYMFRVSVHGHGGTTSAADIMKNGKHVVIAYANQAQGVLNSSNGVVLILEFGDVVYNEISQQISSEDGRQNPPQTDTLRAEASTDRQQYCDLGIPDIHAALRELTATVTEQKENIRALETQLRDEMNKKNEEISSQVEELRKENRDREIAFSASLMESGEGDIGPFTTTITLTYRNVFTNIGNAYNPITGIFTAPLKGAYMFRVSAFGIGPTAASADIVKNGKIVIASYNNQAQNVLNSSNGVVFILEVGDVVYVTLYSGRRIYDNQYNHNTFSGFLLFPLR
ncbi:Complement C1q-like protein 4 [Anabarilius grahami]|uniref:Complement C1q-like protein 4 n=1 Tax=Anabarilius grahami TaxID=495550 RepID=A0A3N0XPH0_ANAGA|nr:Complement C1q-like protein 4 [Anabarilius grahami]